MSSKADIRLEETGSGGMYVLNPDGGPDEGAAARMTFSKAGDQILIIDHTEVPDAFRGQGIGQLLVERAVEDARATGRKIVPLCPFVKVQFQRHPEYGDVLST